MWLEGLEKPKRRPLGDGRSGGFNLRNLPETVNEKGDRGNQLATVALMVLGLSYSLGPLP
jgi:hypothetical protein